MAKYVLSDIHGSLNAWETMLERIHLVNGVDTLYVLGDVIDRGQYGITILKQIMQMSNAKMLLGNHEYMMMKVMETDPESTLYKKRQQHWYMNGGEITHERFLAEDEETQQKILSYIKSLPLEYWDTMQGGRKVQMVHSAPPQLYNKHGVQYRDVTEYSVWDRWTIEAEVLGHSEFPHTVIFGHTPTNHFQISSDGKLYILRSGAGIGIDCGVAYPGGRLCCLCLDNGNVYYTDRNTKRMVCLVDK